MHVTKRSAPSIERPALGKTSVLRLMASTSPPELQSFVTALELAIRQWVAAAEEEPYGDVDAELVRLHALKSITSVLGSPAVTSACDDLSEHLRSGMTTAVVRRRSCAVAIAAQRILRCVSDPSR